SATLESAPVAAFLDDCPVIEVAARQHPIEVRYQSGTAMSAAVRDALKTARGHILCFLAGADEIRRAGNELASSLPSDVSLLPLHGSLSAEDQDRALAPHTGRKVILATNIAETSLTIDGVTDVIDGGYHKVLRYDPERGLDRLERERIGLDSATQRAGRAGRTGPGRVTRLWDARDLLRTRREAEIERVDLCSTLLSLIAWGGRPESFAWFEAPPADAVQAALALLTRLGALESGRLTRLGARLNRFPLHPRLARVLVAAEGAPRAAAACAILSEKIPRWDATHATDSDVLALVDRLREMPESVQRAARELSAVAERVLKRCSAKIADDDLRRALYVGFPDRLARRREAGSPRLLLASGLGAVLGRESGVHDGDYLIAHELIAGQRGPQSEALVRMATRVEKEWLVADRTEREHVFDQASGAVRAIERAWSGAIALSERPVAVDAAKAEEILMAAARARALDEVSATLLARMRFAGQEVEIDDLYRAAVSGHTRLPRIDLTCGLTAAARHALDRLAPETLALPSGRKARIEYRADGSLHVAAKLQELFGLCVTPCVGRQRQPVVFDLLAPSGRPVQTTSDLGSFWQRTYPEVRKELRGRYPRHPWPEDPLSAEPTARAKSRKG
ncbi:MAG: ATP-dependent helicase HrpB, partial [Vicinamibacteria bacterium]|nr:ATP-dependent helicase HrpB [Vicinamibacteria bacterium]